MTPTLVHPELDHIDHILIVDDDEGVRRVYSWDVEALHVRPVSVEGPIHDIADVVAMAGDTGAVLSDHELRVSGYSDIDGAQLVAELNARGVPSVLCTKYGLAELPTIRQYRAQIPLVLSPDDLTPEALVEGFTACVRELRGEFSLARRPVQTLVRFARVDDGQHGSAYVVVPGWNPHEAIEIPKKQLPEWLCSAAAKGLRVLARVNTGAESQEDLYFSEWKPLDE